MAKRNKLGESQSLQQFNRDTDEIETWMVEKMQTASDESYKDPTNLQVILLFHCMHKTGFFFRASYKSIKHLKQKLQQMKKEFFQSSTWVKVNPLISPRNIFYFKKF